MRPNQQNVTFGKFFVGGLAVRMLMGQANPRQHRGHPSGWRADEQGLINPNVSALGDWTLTANQTQRFRYRLLVYRGSATRAQFATRFESLRTDR